jgi:hypothetical protein
MSAGISGIGVHVEPKFVLRMIWCEYEFDMSVGGWPGITPIMST